MKIRYYLLLLTQLCVPSWAIIVHVDLHINAVDKQEIKTVLQFKQYSPFQKYMMFSKYSEEVGLKIYNLNKISVGLWSFIGQPEQKVANQYIIFKKMKTSRGFLNLKY